MSAPGHVGTPEWLTLDRDERVLIRAHPSKNLLLLVVAAGTALFLTLGIAGIALSVDVDFGRTVSLVAMVLLFVATAGVFLLTGYREYVVTSHRICTASGLTSKTVTAVDMEEVHTVELEQSTWQSLINVGNVRFDIDGGTVVRFSAIEKPNFVYERALESVGEIDERRTSVSH